jgi:hypothetical protein
MAEVFSITAEFRIRDLARADQAPTRATGSIMFDDGQLKPVFSGTVFAICHLLWETSAAG